MFIKYRVGGGSDSNVGPNVLTSLGIVNMNVNGPDATLNSAVKTSLKVNNTFPALGGKDTQVLKKLEI
jgi:hypothetical protein